MRRLDTVRGIAAPRGAASPAVVANGFVFASGQVPVAADTNEPPADFADQVRLALSNLSATLEAAGSSLKHAVKITTFLTDPRLAEYNEVYSEVFGDELPARTTVMVAGGEFSIEVQCVAVVPGPDHTGGIRRIANAPGMAPVLGPYSQAVVANGFVFTSGQIPARSSMADQPEDFGGKVRQTLDNLESVLIEAGSGLDRVTKVTTYLTDPDQLDEYNGIYADFFGSCLPARTSCCVDIWDIALEIECIAVIAPEPEPEDLSGSWRARDEVAAS
jgi:reactive intermediate/imine deaminase